MRRAIAALGIFMILSACAGVESYGRAARYRAGVTPPAPIVMPPGAPLISQQYAPADPADGFAGHNGIDFYARRGTPVLAAAPGVVTRAFHEPLYGRRVHIGHGPGPDGRHVFTHYFHLERIDVAPGQKVARGEPIGTMGDSGLLGLAVHLHFEVLRGRSERTADFVDPQAAWVDGPGRVTCLDPAAHAEAPSWLMTVPLPCRPAGRPAPR